MGTTNALLLTLLVFGLSFHSHADTYNFIFPEQQKVRRPRKSRPAPETPREDSSPIIINNNLNTSAQTERTPSVPALAPPEAPHAETQLAYTPVSKGPAVFRLEMGAIRFDDHPRPTWGGLLTAGVDFLSHFGVNAFMGFRKRESEPFAVDLVGGELEFHPFRSDRRDWKVFEGALLIGFQAFRHLLESPYVVKDYTTEQGYIGARLNIFFRENLGVTAVARGNTASQFYEAGLIMRL